MKAEGGSGGKFVDDPKYRRNKMQVIRSNNNIKNRDMLITSTLPAYPKCHHKELTEDFSNYV